MILSVKRALSLVERKVGNGGIFIVCVHRCVDNDFYMG